MEKKLKAWQGWLLFGGTMVIVFVLGLIVASLMEHRAEVVSIYNNRKVDIKGIEARNEQFPNAGGATATHRVAAAVPLVEIADDGGSGYFRNSERAVTGAHRVNARRDLFPR